jgi:hypothetical protein
MAMYPVKCENGHNLITYDYHNKNTIFSVKYCYFCKNDLLKSFINKNNGILISGEAISNESIIKIKCQNNHIWETKFINLKRNSWCPDCSAFKLEKICRLYFEQIFNLPFPKKRPEFLNQENGYNLELDGFNEELKIAFEHQGKQHYEVIKIFKMTKDDLYKTQFRDKLKYEMCNKNNIKLFIISELTTMTKISDLKQCIFDQAVKYNVEKFGNFDAKINFSTLYDTEINEYKKIATDRGGKCLSDFYIDAHYKLQFECKCGYIWWATPANIKYGKTWCMKCSGKEKLTIKHMKELAKLKNGECLSNEYSGMHAKLEWKCYKKEHPSWWAKPNSIKNKHSWCKFCSYDNKMKVKT